MQTTFIVSDLHLGLPYCRRTLFHEFVEALPDGSVLILNGDTVDRPGHELSEAEQATLSLLGIHSRRCRIIWLEGNHDAGYRPPQPGAVEFERFYVVPEHSLYVAHGFYFDNVMPHHRWFMKIFRLLHAVRIKLGAPAVHIAEYAKKWRRLYGYLRNSVAASAVEHARENGWERVACGHVHCPEVRDCGDVIYYNTGTWTEYPPAYLYADDNTLVLAAYTGGQVMPPKPYDQTPA